MKLNLGCGSQHKKEEGWINIDYVEPADLVCDVTKGLPYEDNSVERIEADNLFEHFDNKEFKTVMNECWRVLQPGGRLWFKVPNALDWMDGAFGDPTHKRFFVPRSFRYFTDTTTWENYGKSYGFKCFKQLQLRIEKFFSWEGTPIK